MLIVFSPCDTGRTGWLFFFQQAAVVLLFLLAAATFRTCWSLLFFPACGDLPPLFCLFFLLSPQRLIVLLFIASEQAEQVDCLFPRLAETGWLFCFVFCLRPCAQVNNFLPASCEIFSGACGETRLPTHGLIFSCSSTGHTGWLFFFDKPPLSCFSLLSAVTGCSCWFDSFKYCRDLPPLYCLFFLLACAAKFDCPFVFRSGQAAHVLAETGWLCFFLCLRPRAQADCCFTPLVVRLLFSLFFLSLCCTGWFYCCFDGTLYVVFVCHIVHIQVSSNPPCLPPRLIFSPATIFLNRIAPSSELEYLLCCLCNVTVNFFYSSIIVVL